MIAGRTSYERRWWTLAVLCLCLFTVMVGSPIVIVALPTLAGELSASGSELQWIVNAYVLVMAGLLLTAGALGDRFGRKRALFAGFAIFTVGSVGAALSGSTDLLIAMRVVMAIGGAFIVPSSLSILTNVFPPQERPKAIGFWAATNAVGVPSGLVLGGLLLQHFAWGSIFLVNLPILAVAAAAGSVLVPESRDQTEKPLDPAGALLSMAGVGMLVFALIEAPSNGWASSTTLLLLALAGTLLGAFVRWEMRRERPMLDLSLFRKPSFTGAALAVSLVSFALIGSFFFLAQYLQFVLDFDQLDAGIRMTPVTLGLILGTTVSVRLRPYLGTRVIVAVGLTITAGGLAILATISDASGYGTVLVALAVAGFGMGCTSALATNSIMASVPREHAGVGSAVNNSIRPVGSALGVAVLGSILSTAYRSSIEAATAALPSGAAAATRDSIGSAMQVAARTGGPEGEALMLAARSSFVDAMGTAVLVAVGAALLGAAIAATVLPSRKRELAGEAGITSAHPGPSQLGTAESVELQR